ncbi:hypothetical protein [Archangium sp. Cb G35]|uniref:hypothetical protein n=1 Tax=Archangium sp. Cb G35 TaxID=1920190 RepID=UPI001161299C|nr:hypothetical protein [Archangium sp. Cb G35]
MSRTQHPHSSLLSCLMGVTLWLTGCLAAPEELEQTEQPAPFQESDRELAPAITLPIEVLGAEGTTKSVTVDLTAQDAQQPLRLWLQVYNLSYANKGSVRFNSGAWLPLSNTTVTVEGLGKNYGGIGGAFSTLKLNLGVPAGALVAGSNQISFRFNTSDGRSIGYRVLKLNLLRADGSRILPDSLFVQEDPNTWKPPLADAASIAEGEKLWRTRQLVRSVKNPTAIRARCADCHAQDGRDLKYFNYSNLSIIERSRFHGLSELEGQRIASYIRNLSVANPGRPWNPPYQPGPGLDSKPIEHWAAGAGVDAVVEQNRDMLRYMFPAGITKEAISTAKNLSAREVPIFFQLPDWNHWLPGIHPKDAWGDAFVNDRLNMAYNGEGTATPTESMRSLATRVKASGYTQYRNLLYYPVGQWNIRLFEFLSPRFPSATNGLTTEYSQKVYSTALWHVVKTWELMQEFGLEDKVRLLYPSSRDTRAWMTNSTFDASPNMLKLPVNNTGIKDNSPFMFTYFSMGWYHLSLVLFNGNHSDGADRTSQRPIDWGYVPGAIKGLSRTPGGTTPVQGLVALYLAKGMHTADNTLKPNAPYGAGWSPRTSGDLSRFVVTDLMPGWSDITGQERTAILQAFLSTWWDKTRQYSVSDWWNGGGATKTEVINGFYDGTLGNRIYFMLPRFKYHGVDPALVNTIADWARTVWPQGDWARVRNATCAPYGPYIQCTSDVT